MSKPKTLTEATAAVEKVLSDARIPTVHSMTIRAGKGLPTDPWVTTVTIAHVNQQEQAGRALAIFTTKASGVRKSSTRTWEVTWR